MKNRDTIILVVLAHVGLVLIWLTMGGCTLGRNKPDRDLEVSPVERPSDEELDIDDSDFIITETEPDVFIDEGPSETIAVEPEITTANETEYVVKSGDTLWKISKQYNISVKSIKERNNLQSDMIRSGNILILPTAGAPAAAPPVPAVGAVEAPKVEAVAGEETIPAPAAEAPSENVIEHVVVSGDTIWDLARKYGTTEAAIMKLNNITDPRQLRAGDKIKIPKQ